MSSISSSVLTLNRPRTVSVQEYTERVIEDLLASLPHTERLSADDRRGILARYTAVLEGNFIYWMTGAYLSVASEEARSIILENLREEVRDAHPDMLRRFAIAANGVPTDSDALAVYGELRDVRLFVGRLSPAPSLAMMAFFESLLQRFMAFLADLAQRQGSMELEYTDVHGVCDVAHSQGLYRALEIEMTLRKDHERTDLFEGVELLQTLIRKIVAGPPEVFQQEFGTRSALGRTECQ